MRDAEKLPFANAPKQTASTFGFHHTEPEARDSIRRTVNLLKQRSCALMTITNIAPGVTAHSR